MPALRGRRRPVDLISEVIAEADPMTSPNLPAIRLLLAKLNGNSGECGGLIQQ